MKQIEGLKIRTMTERDFLDIDDLDRRITGREWASSGAQRASSHFWSYYPPLSFVAEINGRIVGFVIGAMGGPEYSIPVSAWINIIAVDPEYQGCGVGSALLKTFIDVCQARGITARLILPKNEHFEKMLLSLGFEYGDLVDYVRKPQ